DVRTDQAVRLGDAVAIEGGGQGWGQNPVYDGVPAARWPSGSGSARVCCMSPKLQVYDFARQLVASREFFERSSRVLDEADSGFRPQKDMMTVAQQVAHVAQTLDWFVEGITRPEGFDLDFEKLGKALEGVTSLAAAREMLAAAYDNAIGFIRARTPEQMAEPL